MGSLYIDRRCSVVVQRLTQLTDVVFEDSITDESTGPNRLQYLLLVDKLSRMLKQQSQNREGLWTQRNGADTLP